MSGSGFSTLNTAVSGLNAAQRALETIGQNIVNSNTPGYSRQRVLLASVGQTVGATFHTGTGAVIGGVTVTDVSRFHNAFIEATRTAAGAKQSAVSAQLDTLSAAEQLLSEPGDTGFQSILDSFYSKWHDLATSVGNSSAAAVVIQKGAAVTDTLRAVGDGVSAQWSTSRNDLEDVVSQVNQTSSDLAKVNAAIEAGQGAGQPVNELMDTQDTLVRKLASLVGAAATTDVNSRLSVSAGGINIVAGSTWTPMSLVGASGMGTATTDPLTLKAGAYTVSPDSGEAAGLLAALRTDLPSMAAKVDTTATSLITMVNGVYRLGHAKDGTTGADFFSGTGAHDISVVPTTTDQLQVAATAGTADTSVAAAIGDLADDAKALTALGTDGPSALWRDLTTSLGIQVQSLGTAKSVADSVVAAADDAVTSESGVNLDEEMTNLMLFQRAYQASARVITTVDELMDTLINRTGRVGL